MASSSAARSGGVTGRIQSAASNLASENHSLVLDIRKSWSLMKNIAVDLERENKSDMVKELENAVVDLLSTYEDHTNFLTAIQSVGNKYRPGTEPTDFKKLFKEEVTNAKAQSSSAPQNHTFVRQFKEAVWNVHHSGEPMPGEEQEDIVMTSTQCNLVNVTCPLSGKPVIELVDPVRSMQCKHIFEKKVIMQYIRSKNGNAKCPAAACPKKLAEANVLCDPLLRIEIEELRAASKQTSMTELVEDFTMDEANG
ncbi:hypothetical protein UlMin_028475 [Ulmus minor]